MTESNYHYWHFNSAHRIISLCSCMSNFFHINTVTFIAIQLTKAATFTENFYRQQINLNLIGFHFQTDNFWLSTNAIASLAIAKVSAQNKLYTITFSTFRLSKFCQNSRNIYLSWPLFPFSLFDKNVCQLHYNFFFGKIRFVKNIHTQVWSC